MKKARLVLSFVHCYMITTLFHFLMCAGITGLCSCAVVACLPSHHNNNLGQIVSLNIPSRVKVHLPDVQKDFIDKQSYYHERTMVVAASFLLMDARMNSSWEQMQAQPPRKLAIEWATTRRTAAARPSWYALYDGFSHSMKRIVTFLTCNKMKIPNMCQS